MQRMFLAVSAAALLFLLCVILLQRVYRDTLKSGERIEKLSGERMASVPGRVRAEKKPRIKISTVLVDQLASAGVPMRAEEFLLIWVVLSFVPAAISALMEAHVFVSVTLSGIGLALPPFYVRHSRSKRLIAFEKQLPDAIASVSNCLKSGLTFQQGMQAVAEQMPEPISKDFGRVMRELQLGSTTERALNNLARRVPSPDVKLLVTAILISQQVGGNLSAVLDNIAQTVTDRIRIKQEVHTITSTGRISGMVIGLLPLILAVILVMMNPKYMQLLFERQEGHIMLIIAAVMEAIGYMLIRKIVSVEY